MLLYIYLYTCKNNHEKINPFFACSYFIIFKNLSFFILSDKAIPYFSLMMVYAFSTPTTDNPIITLLQCVKLR